MNIQPHVIYTTWGQCFNVALISQAGSTGYTWSLTEMSDGLVFIDKSSNQIPPVHPGSPTSEVFTFGATIPSEVPPAIKILKFQLLRPWLPTEPDQTCEFHVTVGPPPNKP